MDEQELDTIADISEIQSYCYLIFNLGSVNNVLEACEMYEKAFGAEKLSEERGFDDQDSWIGVDIKLFNFLIFIQSTNNPLGGNCFIKFASQNEFYKAYDIIKIDAMEQSMYTNWHWTPLSALIKDKFGVNWLFCVSKQE